MKILILPDWKAYYVFKSNKINIQGKIRDTKLLSSYP